MQNISTLCDLPQFMLSAWIKRTQEHENVIYPRRVQLDHIEVGYTLKYGISLKNTISDKYFKCRFY